jgi:hypothetical protein
MTLDTAISGTIAVKQVTTSANQADLIVSISASASTTPLIAGEFQDTLIIKVGPAI